MEPRCVWGRNSGVRVIFSGNLGQISMFGGFCAELAFVLVGVVGGLS